MSAELWNLIVKSDVEFLLKSDVSSQSVMTKESISKTTITTLTVSVNVT